MNRTPPQKEEYQILVILSKNQFSSTRIQAQAKKAMPCNAALTASQPHCFNCFPMKKNMIRQPRKNDTIER